MRIKTIFFDLGGVLINFSHEKMCQNLAKVCDLDIDLVKAYIFEKKLGEEYERGAIDSQMLYKYFSELSKKSLEYEGLMQAISSIFSLKEEMPPILEELKKQNIALILLSNTCEAHFCQVQKQFPFLKLFDGFVLSYEVKARKPEKAIYDAALAMGEVKADECFYVDDVLEYVEAAESYGIDSHHFDGAENLIAALEKRDINPLKDV